MSALETTQFLTLSFTEFLLKLEEKDDHARIEKYANEVLLKAVSKGIDPASTFNMTMRDILTMLRKPPDPPGNWDTVIWGKDVIFP